MRANSEQQREQAELILEASDTRDMYVSVLATAIVGRLSAQEPTSRYETPAPEALAALLDLDARFGLHYDASGLPIARLV